jgi:hypothetical protein
VELMFELKNLFRLLPVEFQEQFTFELIRTPEAIKKVITLLDFFIKNFQNDVVKAKLMGIRLELQTAQVAILILRDAVRGGEEQDDSNPKV